MQKYLKITIQILCLITLVHSQGRLAGDTFVHAHKGTQPISEQSCSKTPSMSYGWFWDGQKCERCASDECTCQDYNKCDECLDGYVKITDGANPDGKCIKCPGFNEIPYFNTRDFYPQASTNKNVPPGSSLLIHTGANDIVKSCCNPLGTVPIWTEKMRKALRAESCIAGTNTGRVYKFFGSICWYLDGCTAYTDVGKCSTCQEGYYLDDNQICRTCRMQCMEKGNEPNITVSQAINIQPCANQRVPFSPCQSCKTADQCETCIRGYYMAKSTYFDKQTSDTDQLGYTLQDASWCRKCAKNCHCIPNASGNMTYTPLSAAWYMDETEECKVCNTFTGQTLCSTCEYTKATTTTSAVYKCLTCAGSSINGRAVTQTVSNNTCLECDVGCFRCVHFDTSTTTCKIDQETFCMNGYRVQNNTSGSNSRITCTKCESQDATRCKIQSDGSEQITQCKTDGNIGNYEVGVVGYHNRIPPSTQDFYLILSGSTNKCVQNKYNCRTMKTSTTDGLCSACYPGYFLIAEQCIRCGIGKTLSCKECINGDLEQGLQCSSCSIGYALDTREATKKQCVLCVGNCAVCSFSSTIGSTAGQCSQCIEGYNLDLIDKTINQCRPCIVENCRACTQSVLLCDSCIDTYRLWQSTTDKSSRSSQFCEQCEFGCLTCTTERKQCSQCAEGFYLWHGVCHRPKNNCAKMNGFDCAICEIGYRRVDTQCLRCFDLEGGFVHCHQGCDVSNTRWNTNIDNTWTHVNDTKTISGSVLNMCLTLVILIISLIM